MVSAIKRTALTLTALLLAVVLAVPALAETLYVRDVVIINLRAAPQPSAETLGLLRTGDSFEVLEKKGRYYRVKNEAGKKGWIDSQYAVAERPAVLLVREAVAKADRAAKASETAARETRLAKAELDETLGQLEKVRREGNRKLNATSGEVGSLTKELAALKKTHASLLSKSSNIIEIDAERERLAAQNAGLTDQLALTSEKAESLSEAYALKWFFGGAGVLVLGWVIGVVTGKKKKQRSYS
jgi:SH3 domain protein